MKRIMILFTILGILFISACGFYKTNDAQECKTDNDCATGGCSGEICTTKENAKNIVSICIYKPEYDCLKQTSCKCLQGKCQWKQTQEYKDCMANLPSFE